MPNTPIVNTRTSYPFGALYYINGLNISKTSDTSISMDIGAARDIGNIGDIFLNSSVNIDGTTTGENGVDTSVLIANKLYAVYAIGDSNFLYPSAGLLSLNAIEPNLPANYDMYRRVGWIFTDGSANILQFFQYGHGQERPYCYDIPVNVLTAGNSNVFADVDLSAAVPPILTQVTFQMTYLASFGISKVQFLPFGFTQTNGIISIDPGIAITLKQPLTAPAGLDNGIPKIQYKVSQILDQLTLSVSGFVDYIY